MMRSPCCNAPLFVGGHTGVTHWYACTVCGQPCDPVDADAGEKEGEK